MSVATLLPRHERPQETQTPVTAAEVGAVLELVVLRAGEDTTYETPEEGSAVYVHEGEPHCLVALVLVELGFTVDELVRLGNVRPTSIDLPADKWNDELLRRVEASRPLWERLTPAARTLLDHVQEHQDDEAAWGNILRWVGIWQEEP